jgi:two-component system cell cycle sensor histidine kinase/response regulator CckA
MMDIRPRVFESIIRMTAFCPDGKHMFMPGYTADIIMHRGMLDESVHLLHKPFSKKDLPAAVRMTLDG